MYHKLIERLDKGHGFYIEYKEGVTWRLRKFGDVFRNIWIIPWISLFEKVHFSIFCHGSLKSTNI